MCKTEAMIKMKLASLIVLSILALSNCTTAFIEEGVTDPSVEEVTYQDEIQPIMFNHCTTCHGGSTPFADLSLETYDTVKEATENGNLLSRIENEDNPMPPSGLLTAEDRAKIAKWAAEGFN